MRATLAPSAVFLVLLVASMLKAETEDEKNTRIYNRSAQEAVKLYPDAARVGTPFYNFMGHLDGWLRWKNDPLFFDPNKPMVIAKLVASWLAKGLKAPATATFKPPSPEQSGLDRKALKALGYDYDKPSTPDSGAVLVLPMGGGNFITNDGKAYHYQDGVVTRMND